MDLEAVGFRIPLKVPFRGVRHRSGVLLRGPFGWGEYSPLPGYRRGSERRCLAAATSAAREPWPAPVRAEVPVHVTVPPLPPDEAAALVAGSGCTAAKVKVAEGDDDARVRAVREVLGASGRIVVDANGGWDVETAERMLKVLGRHAIELAEQPVGSLEEMAALRKRVDVPLGADEAVATVEDARRVADLEAADVLIVKVQPLGGVNQALQAVEAAGLPAAVSSMLETSIGVAAGLALAACLPDLPYTCGLGSVALLEGDVVADPLAPRDGVLQPRRPEVDRAALERFRANVSVPAFDADGSELPPPAGVGIGP